MCWWAIQVFNSCTADVGSQRDSNRMMGVLWLCKPFACATNLMPPPCPAPWHILCRTEQGTKLTSTFAPYVQVRGGGGTRGEGGEE